eukprot:13713224-Alexandrium_andersonii.AAC.1
MERSVIGLGGLVLSRDARGNRRLLVGVPTRCGAERAEARGAGQDLLLQGRASRALEADWSPARNLSARGEPK